VSTYPLSANGGCPYDARPRGEAATSVLRSRTRQIITFRARHGRLPADLTQCEQPPGAGGQVVLAAVDKQLATLERCAQDPSRWGADPAAAGAARARIACRLAWVSCPKEACGCSTGRDNAAWQRIGARGLTNQHTTSLDRSSGTFAIRSVVKALDRASTVPHQTRDRTKSGPTAQRPAPGKRRRVPAPPGNGAPTARPRGQRPVGWPRATSAPTASASAGPPSGPADPAPARYPPALRRDPRSKLLTCTRADGERRQAVAAALE
jgi:hypothetical protein